MRPARVVRFAAALLTCLDASAARADDAFSPPAPVTRASRRAVRHLKDTLASSIEPRLPAVPFERWVVDTLGSDWSVTWKVSIGHWARTRVLAEDRLYVEVIATPRSAPGEIQLAMLVGTFGGLRAPRLDYGSFWRDGAHGRESGSVPDLWPLADVKALVVRGLAPAASDAIGSLRDPRNQLAVVARVQELTASSLDAELPDVRLGRWVREAFAPDVELDWNVSDCDLKASDEVCVKIDARRRGVWAKVHVLTGTNHSPWSGRPELMRNGLAGCRLEFAGIDPLAEFPRVFQRPGWDRCH
jgi:hypothetical protein